MNRLLHRSDEGFVPFSVLLMLNLLCCSSSAYAVPPNEQLRINLPSSIYTTLSDPASLDKDRDGLKDDYENRLADAWRPYFIFDEHENDRKKCHDVISGTETIIDSQCVIAGCALLGGIGCAYPPALKKVKNACKSIRNTVVPVCGDNVDDDSLQPFEPVTLFQVRPLDGNTDWPRKIIIKWGFLWRLDGGARTNFECTDWHYGDTQSGTYILISNDGFNWSIDTLDLWKSGTEKAKSYSIEWTAPRGSYGDDKLRASPIVYASAGKHHQYISATACETSFWGPSNVCDDDCGGGAERLCNLTPTGVFNNIGENSHRLLDDLASFGYPGDNIWWTSHICNCPGGEKQECFTGGRGDKWTTSGWPQCTVTSAIYTLFDNSNQPELPSEMGDALMSVILM